MSLFKNYYVIAGYDLTGYATEKYEDWKWTDEGEQYICRQRKGNVQLFDDPCNGEHFYFGYVLANGDQYEFHTTSIDLTDLDTIRYDIVDTKLRELYDLGIIDRFYGITSQFKVFVFEEVS